MFCEKFDERLQQLLDQRQEPAEDRELQHHAQQCADCRALLQGQQQLFSSLRLNGGQELPDRFAHWVVAVFLAERTPQRRWWQNTWVGAFIAVAALLMLSWIPAARRRSNEAVPPRANAASVVNDASLSTPAENPLTTNIEPVESSQGASAGAKGEPVAVASATPPGHGAGDWIDNLRESISEVSLENLEPMDQIADGFRPVATSLQSAVGVLRRTLPGGGEQRHKPLPDASGMWNSEPTDHV